jgi:hypothetical protein
MEMEIWQLGMPSPSLARTRQLWRRHVYCIQAMGWNRSCLSGNSSVNSILLPQQLNLSLPQSPAIPINVSILATNGIPANESFESQSVSLAPSTSSIPTVVTALGYVP